MSLTWFGQEIETSFVAACVRLVLSKEMKGEMVWEFSGDIRFVRTRPERSMAMSAFLNAEVLAPDCKSFNSSLSRSRSESKIQRKRR